jgi:phenylacetate-coenzyme A ligase PaaK-like adenylate-forming protein
MQPVAANKLLRLLKHAQRSTAFYSRLPDLPVGADPEVVAQYFSCVPTLSRNQLRSEPARLLSCEGNPAAWRRIRTSGTTGKPVEVVLDEGARAAEAVLFGGHVDQTLGDNMWRKLHVYHLTLHPGASSLSIPSSWGTGGARAVKWNLIHAWQGSDGSFGHSLNCLGGCVIAMLPSVADLVCSRLLRAGLAGEVQPRLVILSGEQVEPTTRRRIREMMGCPVTSFYTLAEAGIVGLESGKGGCYRFDETRVLVEILGEDGFPVPVGTEGEIVVTPLDNLAMPLLRYRTGDRASWMEGSCAGAEYAGCFVLSGGRQPTRLITMSGASLNVIRFAKVLEALEVDRYSIGQLPDKTVVFSYEGRNALDGLSHSIVESVVRNSMGPGAAVRVRRVSGIDHEELEGLHAVAAQTVSEPEGPGMEDITRWLQKDLAGKSGIEAAVITGSALDVAARTRFSDVDLVVLIAGDPSERRWLELVRDLKSAFSRLSVNIDRLASLQRRAPLLACRLLSEQRPVIGTLDEKNLPRPSMEDLRRQGIYWAQDSAAVLWHRLVGLDRRAVDSVREAWVAGKHALDAFRFRYLLTGHRETCAKDVIALAQADPELRSTWLDVLLEAFDVSREFIPPFRPDQEASHAYLQAALCCVRHILERF